MRCVGRRPSGIPVTGNSGKKKKKKFKTQVQNEWSRRASLGHRRYGSREHPAMSRDSGAENYSNFTDTRA